jgi:hypothetical protein
VVESDIKKHARLNMISHLLSTIDYHDVDRPNVELPPRWPSPPLRAAVAELSTYVPITAALLGDRA